MDIHMFSFLVTVLCWVFVRSRKLGQRTEIIIVAVAISALMLSFLESDFIGMDVIDTLYENSKDHMLFDFFVVVGSMGFVVLSGIAMIPCMGLLFFVIDRIRDRVEKTDDGLFVTMLDKSKLFPSGVLYFDVKYKNSITRGFFTADISGNKIQARRGLGSQITRGFFTADISGAFDQCSICSKHYDDSKQSGTLSGRNNSFGLKWRIPDDFAAGPCKILIKAKCTIKLFGFFLPVSYTLKERELECEISQNAEEGPYRYVDEKISLVDLRIDSLEEKMNKRFDSLENSIERLRDMILDEPSGYAKTRYAKGEITKEEFIEKLKIEFFSHPFTKKIDEFINPDAYFGRIKEWIHENCTDVPLPKRWELTENVQAVYDWFEKLGDGKYVIDVPGAHSQRITKVKL